MVAKHGRDGKFQSKGKHEGEEGDRDERSGGASAPGKRAAGANARQDKKWSTATGAGADINKGRTFPGACGRSIFYAAIFNTVKNKVVSSFALLFL